MNNVQQETPQSGIVFTEKDTFLYKTYIDNKLQSVYADGNNGVYVSSESEITPTLENNDKNLLEYFAKASSTINVDESQTTSLAPITTEFVFIKLIGDQVLLGGRSATTEMITDGWFEYSGVIPKESLRSYDYLAMENSEIIIKTDINKQRTALVEETKKYLADTDYKMTVDYFAQLTTEQQQELTEKRDTARKFIREHAKHVNTTTTTTTTT
jgi:hypothetical protein